MGPEYSVTVGYEPRIVEQKGAVKCELKGRELRIVKPLAKEAVWTRLEGFGEAATENVMRVGHDGAGVGVEISTDRPIRRWVLFALRSAFCPEAFVEVEVGPGEMVEWGTGYRFFEKR